MQNIVSTANQGCRLVRHYKQKVMGQARCKIHKPKVVMSQMPYKIKLQKRKPSKGQNAKDLKPE